MLGSSLASAAILETSEDFLSHLQKTVKPPATDLESQFTLADGAFYFRDWFDDLSVSISGLVSTAQSKAVAHSWRFICRESLPDYMEPSDDWQIQVPGATATVTVGALHVRCGQLPSFLTSISAWEQNQFGFLAISFELPHCDRCSPRTPSAHSTSWSCSRNT